MRAPAQLAETGVTTYVQVFGGLRLWRGGIASAAGSPQQQLLLAGLLAAGGHAVSTQDLVALLWEGDSPDSAVNQIHRLIGRLRRDLQPELAPRETGGWVHAAGAGYRLTVPLDCSDLGQFRALVLGARQSAEPDGLRNWIQALQLAEGAAFAGLPPRVLERPEIVAMQEERRSAAAEAAEAALRLGRAADLLDPVRVLAGEAPLDERLQAHTIRLLAAAGRRAEALARYDDLRRRLRDELGIDPGPELRAAQRDVLATDGPPAAGPASAAAVNQLPAPIPAFTDRDGGLAALDEQLAADPSGTVVVTAVAGMAGVGKTALAVQWAHTVADRFPDGQLFLNLRGFDPAGRTVTPSEALSTLCSVFEVSLADLPEDAVDARAARFRGALAGRRVLLLLDNARDSAHVRPLLPGAPGCLAVVTSRNRMSSLVVREGARILPLGRLTAAEGARLLTGRLGARRVGAEPAAVDAIVAACAGLPLALAIAAAQAATNPTLSLADVAAGLAAARLNALATDDGLDDVRGAFGLSYDALSPAAARLFRLLAAYPGPEVPLTAAASVAGVPIEVARRLVAELLTASMLGEASPGRYTVHDLLQIYGAELLDTAGERADAERRLVHHYAASTRAAYLTYGRAPVGDLAAAEGPLAVEQFPDISAAWRWFAAERPALIAAVRLAVAHGLDRCAATIALDWRPMSQGLLTHLELEPHVSVALQAAYRTGDLRLQGDLERDLAAIQDKLDRDGDAASAAAHWNRALEVFRALDDPTGQTQTLRNLAQSAALKKKWDVAEQTGRRALGLARTLGRPDLVTLCLWELGAMFHQQRERQADAVKVLSEARDLAQAHGLAYLESDIVMELSQCLLKSDRPKRALAVIDDYLRASGDRSPADPETHVTLAATLAVAAFRVGDIDRATTACLEFAARRRSAGPLVQHVSSWTDWIIEIQNEVIDTARVLGLDLDLPDGR